MGANFDFSGWATRNDLKCSDGRTIRRDAFKHNDGQTVPLVWNHLHNDPLNVLGHALLENREQGVYAYCTFNDTEAGQNARELVQHGDVTALSIYANQLKQQGGDVLHGAIREVSLVLAGANPGALIDSIISHGEESEEEAIIYTEEPIMLRHADEPEEKVEPEKKASEEPKPEDKGEEKMADSEKTVQEVFDTLNEEQKTVVYALIGQAIEDAKGGADDEEDGGEDMKHNVFDADSRDEYMAHAEMMQDVLADAKRYGSLKESFLAHAEVQDASGFGNLGYTVNEDGTTTPGYGIGNVDYLFPDAHLLDSKPQFIKRDTDWVQKVMNGTHHTPFSRIKSMFADITEDEARAKGYIKGKMKKEEIFGLLKRTTTPTTIYKKQKMDRDDVIDITDFDVVAWLKSEMRLMLDEEIARAILIGDGRLVSSDDKINEQNIRPILSDADLFTIKQPVAVAASATDQDKAKTFIRSVIKSRKLYKGSGNPTLYTTEDVLTDCLLIEDAMGRVIYDTEEKLRTALRVKEIVTVPVMEGLQNKDGHDVLGIIVNLADYTVGADKGGAVNMFDDFDIDYNQQKYLIETRCSGALTKPYSAIALHVEASA